MRTFAAIALATTLLAPPALGRPGPDKQREEQALTILERGAKAGDFGVRATAVEGLGWAPKKAGLSTVKDAVTDPQWIVRAAALRALHTLKDAAWERELRNAVCDLTVNPTRDVMPLLRPLGPKVALPVLLKALGSKDCATPTRYVPVIIAEGTAWTTQAFADAGPKYGLIVVNAFTDALPTLAFPDAFAVYRPAFARYPAPLQATLAARIAALPEGAQADIAFLKPLLKSSDAAAAFSAAVALAHRKDPSGRALLLDALSSPDEARRLTALDALLKIPDAATHERMKDLIRDPQSSYELLIRAYAVYNTSKSQKLQSYLEEQLNSTDLPQRAAAVRFIAQVKGRAALADLHPLIATAPKTIKLAAVGAAGDLAQRESIPVLRDALQREQDPELKRAELAALAAIRDVEILPIARLYLADRDPEVRAAAIAATVAVPDAGSIPDLQLLMQRDLQKDLRDAALFAIIAIDPTAAQAPFERALAWLDPAQLRKLAPLPTTTRAALLRAALRSNRDEIRATAWSMTADLDAATASELAQDRLKQSDRPAERLSALERLISRQGKQAVPMLVELSNGSDEALRVAAITALADLGTREQRLALAPLLESQHEATRVAAAAAILRK